MLGRCNARRMKISHVYGFSLIEVMLSIALLALLIAVSFPVFQQTQNQNAAILAANTIEQSVHRAVQLARAGQHDSDWGVKVVGGSITLFQGSSYATRNTDYDEVFSIPSNVSFSATPEIIFPKITGVSSADQTITVGSSSGVSITLTVLTTGVVNR